jgi:hypothetical protein
LQLRAAIAAIGEDMSQVGETVAQRAQRSHHIADDRQSVKAPAPIINAG